MSGLLAFVRKELLESLRTFRVLVVAVAFLVVGLGSPILAKVTPELVKGLSSDQLGTMELVMLQPPGVRDALMQYQKNFGLLPLVVLLLMAGAVSGEKAKGTAALVLVKPVSRGAFLAAKVGVPGLLVTAGTALGAGACLFYTWVLFGPVDLGGYLLLNALLLLSLWVWLALGALASTLTRNVVASVGVALGGYGVLLIVGALPGVGTWGPGGLGQAVNAMILGRDTGPLWKPVAASAVLAVAFLAAAAASLRRQEL